MASISANGSRGHHRFTLNVNETSTNAGANQSTVSFSLVLSPIQNDWDWNVSRDPVTYNINIDGTNYSGSIVSYNGYSTVTIRSGTKTITHNADGSKYISFSFNINGRPDLSYTPGNAAASGGMNLTKFQRAPSYTSVSASEITRTSVRLKGSVNTNGLSITGGGWDVGKSTSSYTYHEGGPTDSTITGLTPNTKYYYRGYVITAGGGANSAWNNFTTSGNAPTLNSVTASNVTRTTANLSISASYDTNASYKAVEYTYGTTSGSYPNSTDSTMSGLTPNTTYYIRARVQDNWNRWSGYKYTSFTTSGNAPTISSHGVQSYGQDFMQMQFTASYDTNDGLDTYTWTATLQDGGPSCQSIDSNTISGLMPNTYYNYTLSVTSSRGRTTTVSGSFKTDYPTQQIISFEKESVTEDTVYLKLTVPNPSWLTNYEIEIKLPNGDLVQSLGGSNISEIIRRFAENLDAGTHYIATAVVYTISQNDGTSYKSEAVSIDFMTDSSDPVAIVKDDGLIERHKMYVMGKGNIYNSSRQNWQNGFYNTGNVGDDIFSLLTQSSSVTGGAACTTTFIEVIPGVEYTITNVEDKVSFIIHGTDVNNKIVTPGYTLAPQQTYSYIGAEGATRMYTSIYSDDDVTINQSTSEFYKMNIFRAIEKTLIPKDNIVYINGKIRYIDILQAGNNWNNNAQIVELEAYDMDGNNVALNKTVTAVRGLNSSNLQAITDGFIDPSDYCTIEPVSEDDLLTIARVDLGKEYNNIASVKLWRKYDGNFIYNKSCVYGRDEKLRLTWKFHSYKKEGIYQETAEGHQWNITREYINQVPTIINVLRIPDNSQSTIIGTNIVINASIMVSVPPVLDSYISYRTDAILAANRGRILQEEIGTLNDLITIAKEDLVAAINEIYISYEGEKKYSNVLNALLNAPLNS